MTPASQVHAAFNRLLPVFEDPLLLAHLDACALMTLEWKADTPRIDFSCNTLAGSGHEIVHMARLTRQAETGLAALAAALRQVPLFDHPNFRLSLQLQPGCDGDNGEPICKAHLDGQNINGLRGPRIAHRLEEIARDLADIPARGPFSTWTVSFESSATGRVHAPDAATALVKFGTIRHDRFLLGGVLDIRGSLPVVARVEPDLEAGLAALGLAVDTPRRRRPLIA